MTDGLVEHPVGLDRFELTGWLGEGAVGRVDAAVDKVSGRRVALKRLRAPTREQHERLAREGAVQRQLAHEHVLPILEIVATPDGVVLVMPLVEGPTLARLMAESPPSLAQRKALFRQIVEGVAAIHAAGFVHRDLKPGNVLLDPSGDRLRAKVADLGLVQVPGAPALTRPGAVLGTPAYMAPEQHAAAHVDARADVYALGVMLAELLTGSRPTAAHAGHSPWDDLARHLLSPDPGARPADAGEVLARLPPVDPIDERVRESCRTLGPSLGQEPAPEVPRHLPPEGNGFVGRREELFALSRVIAEERWVTVVGSAGVGKTRLAVRYATIWLDDHPGGAWFCDLSAARDLDGIVMAVANVLGVPLGREEPAAHLGRALAGRGRCLVLLDNAEQVAAAMADVLSRWVSAAPDAHFLVTSRSPLGLDPERLVELHPPSRPEAEQLFWRRAREADPSLAPPTEADRRAVTELVGLLDALPLAVELAAARVRLLAPAEILARMGQRFRLLAVPGRVDRHATLEAALDGSFELLAADEQHTLAQLSVFEGGATPAAADAVIRCGTLSPRDAVARLVHQSLVRGGERVVLLRSVQEYAARKLSDPDRAAVEARHGQYFAQLVDEAGIEALDASGGLALRKAVARELDNLLTASRRGVARGDGPVAAGAALAAWAVLGTQGPLAVGAELLEAAAGYPSPLRGLALRQAGAALVLCGRTAEARVCYDAALTLHREQGERAEYAITLGSLGNLFGALSRPDEACAHLEESLRILRVEEHRRGQARSHVNLGQRYEDQGRMDEARAHYEASVALNREVGNTRSEGVALMNLGRLSWASGRLDLASGYLERALAIHRAFEDRHFEGAALGNLGLLYVSLGRVEEAEAYLRMALALHREVGHRRSEGLALANLGVLLVDSGRIDEGAACYESALRIHREVGNRRNEGLVLACMGELDRLEGRLDRARERVEQALLLHREVRNPRGEGLALVTLGEIRLEEGRLDEARALLDEGARVLRPRSAPLPMSQLLAVRARVEHEAGASEAAWDALREAEQLAAEVGIETRSAHAVALRKLRALLVAGGA